MAVLIDYSDEALSWVFVTKDRGTLIVIITARRIISGDVFGNRTADSAISRGSMPGLAA